MKQFSRVPNVKRWNHEVINEWEIVTQESKETMKEMTQIWLLIKKVKLFSVGIHQKQEKAAEHTFCKPFLCPIKFPLLPESETGDGGWWNPGCGTRRLRGHSRPWLGGRQTMRFPHPKGSPVQSSHCGEDAQVAPGSSRKQPGAPLWGARGQLSGPGRRAQHRRSPTALRALWAGRGCT